MVCSHNHCYHGNTICSLYIADPHVDVNNTELLSVAMETQEEVPLALPLNYKIFQTAVNNINVFKSSCKMPDTVVYF